MTHISRSVSIGRPAEAVFGMLTDVDRLPEWATTVIETRDMSHPTLRAGCTFRQSFRILGQAIDSEWRLTEYDAPRRIAYVATSAGGGRLEMTQTVAPEDDGSQVTLAIDYELPGGLIGRIVDMAVAEGQIEREAERSLENLKRLLEGGTSSTLGDRT